MIDENAHSVRSAAHGLIIMRLSASNLTVERGGRIIFTNLSFALEAGESLTVTGPNGAGKSTLLRVLAGLLPRLGGDDLADAGNRRDDCRTSSLRGACRCPKGPSHRIRKLAISRPDARRRTWRHGGGRGACGIWSFAYCRSARRLSLGRAETAGDTRQAARSSNVRSGSWTSLSPPSTQRPRR